MLCFKEADGLGTYIHIYDYVGRGRLTEQKRNILTGFQLSGLPVLYFISALKNKKIETILCWQARMPDSPVILIFLQILLLLYVSVYLLHEICTYLRYKSRREISIFSACISGLMEDLCVMWPKGGKNEWTNDSNLIPLNLSRCENNVYPFNSISFDTSSSSSPTLSSASVTAIAAATLTTTTTAHQQHPEHDIKLTEGVNVSFLVFLVKNKFKHGNLVTATRICQCGLVRH